MKEEIRMKRTLAVLLLSALPALADEVTLKKVKYKELAKVVASHKGKVVVVDFWATYCVPCKRSFPHLVALHQKYQRRGLVVVSVSVDDVNDGKAVAAARAFLAQQKATMSNYLLDAAPEVWLKKVKDDEVQV